MDLSTKISLATAIFTGIYMVLTFFMWRAMLVANRKTEAALAETRRSNDLTEDMLQFAHRPSIHCGELTHVWQPLPGKAEARLAIVFSLYNAGDDTAHGVVTDMNFTSNAPTRGVVDLVKPVRLQGDIAARTSHEIRVTIDPQPDVREALKLVKTAYLTIVVAYVDEFENRYRSALILRFREGNWSKEDEWRSRVKTVST